MDQREKTVKKLHFKRFTYHPVLTNSHSRSILIFFAIIVFTIGNFAWTIFEKTSTQLGLASTMFDASCLNLFLSPYFKWVFFLVISILAAGLTAFQVVGPIARIEQWLIDWYSGFPTGAFLSRKKDEFNTLIKLLNEYQNKVGTTLKQGPKSQ